MANMYPREVILDACDLAYLDARDYINNHIAESDYFSRTRKGLEIFGYYDEEFRNTEKKRIVKECADIVEDEPLYTTCRYAYDELLESIEDNFGSRVAQQIVNIFRTPERKREFVSVCKKHIDQYEKSVKASV
jgi:hypothetical protein